VFAEDTKPTTAHLAGDSSIGGESMNGAPLSPNASMSPVFKRPSDLLESPAMKRVRYKYFFYSLGSPD